MLRYPFTANVCSNMKRIRWKAGVSPPTERITLLHLEIKKLKVSGVAPDITCTFINTS